MSTFDFVTGEEFRSVLESDARDLTACVGAGAWKAVLVLSGSIVEALLVDYLVSSEWQKKSGKDPLKLELAEAVVVCKGEGVLTSRTADLCSVVRSYRNLIHPGRTVRLGDRADEASARIAQSLVGIIIGEIAKARRETFGLTAEQVLAKLERDSSSLAILPHLLHDLKDTERERLLLSILPNAYLQLEQVDATEFDDFQSHSALKKRLREAHRTTFDSVPEATRRKVVAHYARIIRNDSEFVVLAYGTAFMRASDLAYADASVTGLIRDHILSRMKEGLSDDVLSLASGVEKYLDIKHVGVWIDSFVQSMTSSDDVRRNRLRQVVVQAFVGLPQPSRDRVLTRLKDWTSHYQVRGQAKLYSVVSSLEAALLPYDDDDLPF